MTRCLDAPNLMCHKIFIRKKVGFHRFPSGVWATQFKSARETRLPTDGSTTMLKQRERRQDEYIQQYIDYALKIHPSVPQYYYSSSSSSLYESSTPPAVLQNNVSRLPESFSTSAIFSPHQVSVVSYSSTAVLHASHSSTAVLHISYCCTTCIVQQQYCCTTCVVQLLLLLLYSSSSSSQSSCIQQSIILSLLYIIPAHSSTAALKKQQPLVFVNSVEHRPPSAVYHSSTR